MQKVISINVLKPMLLVIRAKLKTKIEREIKSQTQSNGSLFKKSTESIKKQAMILYSDQADFVHQLEICCKQTGDVIMSADELEQLNLYYEEDL